MNIRLQVVPTVPWASSRLENARIDIKIGIRAKLTGPDRLVIFQNPAGFLSLRQMMTKIFENLKTILEQ